MNHVEDILNKALEIHTRKRADYTTNPELDPHENFTRSNQVAAWFPDDYKSFAVLIGTKLARIASLLVTGRQPNNESLEDSFVDLVTYCALFYAFWKSKQAPMVSNWLENRQETERKVNWSVICKTCRLPIAPDADVYLDKQYFAHHGYCKV